MPNNEFLKKLLVKLKSGDARSIHLNALPSNLGRIDIFDFVNLHQSLHLQFLQQLFTQQKFSFNISVDSSLLANKNDDEKKVIQQLIKKFNHLYFQDEENEQEHGYHSFGFGYPLLVKRDNTNKDKIIKAPLFIWYLKIEKDLRKTNSWNISRDEDLPVVLNPVLISYLQSNENISFKELEIMLDDEMISEKELLDATQIITEKLGNKQPLDNFVATILPCTNKESIELLTKDNAWIRFSGVFGLYKTIKQSIINDVEQLVESNTIATLHQANHECTYNDVIAANELDDTQEAILFALKKNQKIIIQGPPGTGKSQTLTAIIANALLNEKKVLVVCEKKTALEVLQQNLSKINLAELSVLIEDVHADRRIIVEKVRDYIETKSTQELRFRQHEYEQTKNKFNENRSIINNAIDATYPVIFGDDNWIDLLLSVSETQQKIDINKANSIQQQIKNSLFQFNYDEYIELGNVVQNAKDLYQKCNNYTSFQSIDNEVIQKFDAPSIENAITEYNKASDEIIANINQNKNNKYYNTLSGWLSFVYKIFAIFSSNIRQQREAQQRDLKLIHDFISKWNALPLFDCSFQQATNVVQEFEPSIHNWKQKFQSIYDSNTCFKEYYQYQKFVLNQNEKSKHIIQVLESAQLDNWSEYYNYWYRHQIISNYAFENNIHQLNAQNISALKIHDEDAKKVTPQKIQHLWETKRQNLIANKDITNLKYLYNLRKNKQFESKNTLRKVVQDDIDFFTTFFPVIFTNPSVCTSIFPAQAIFDIIILDEASQLKIEETYSSLLRGKQHVISGDKHQMPPSNFFGSTPIFWTEESETESTDFLADSQSLLEFADDAGYKNHYIDFHYRSKHPDLIQFSNHAFYESRLIPMPASKNYQAIEYYAIEGIYEKGTNQLEAQAVVDFIFTLDIAAAVPSVGIGTFNIFQRDLILDLIYEKAAENTSHNQQLETLLAKGLFVKNLENIQGDERDILILSTTFGKNKEGKFRQLFGPLSQEKGYKLLNVIITRAKEKLIIFTSIPNDNIQQYHDEISTKGNTGKGILYAYLAYARQVSANNEQQKNFILNQLQKNTKSNTSTTNHIQYVEHIYQTLHNKFGNNIARNFSLGGIQLSLILKKDEQIVAYLNLVDVDVLPKESNYRKHIHLENILNNYNIKTIVITSYEWQTAQEKIINEIEKYLK
jgi:superfamily I DNA and/or RNA helicase